MVYGMRGTNVIAILARQIPLDLAVNGIMKMNDIIAYPIYLKPSVLILEINLDQIKTVQFNVL